MKDRFTKISNDYGELFSEVFAAEGLNYQEFEESVYNEAVKIFSSLTNISILDIGIGDGETSKKFIAKGCKNITGVDLNPQMVKAVQEKYGDKIKVYEADATNLSKFEPHQFELIIAGAAVHNIPRKERPNFWSEVLRLDPKTLILAEKIADPNPEQHKKYYKAETNALHEIYGEKHGLPEVEKEWLDHYKYDEKECLALREIEKYLNHNYRIKVVAEYGMCKTVICTRKVNE
jgi:ubiquinone/menaquinone biosynthesis C-methylase UbiE